jgi:hypothetical protein
MSQICVDTVFPEFTAIYLAIRQLLIKAPDLYIPMPTVPNPFMSDINWPTIKAINISIELMTFSVLNFLYQLISPALAFVKSFGFNLPWPKVPILDIELPDLLSFDMAAIIAIVRAKFPDLSKFYALIPLMPGVMFPTMSIPSLNIIEAIQMLIKNFIVTTAGWIIALFNIIKGIVNKKPFNLGLSLPEFPTLPTDWASLLALVGLDPASLEALFKKAGVKIDAFFAKIKIPGFSLPDFSVLFPDLGSPEVSFFQIMKVIFLAVVLILLKVFKTVCDALKSIIGFSFPKICI